MRSYSQVLQTAKAFTAEQAWFMNLTDIFSGTSVEKAFLHYTVIIPESKYCVAVNFGGQRILQISWVRAFVNIKTVKLHCLPRV